MVSMMVGPTMANSANSADRIVWRREVLPFLLWTATFPLVIGFMAGAMTVAINTIDSQATVATAGVADTSNQESTTRADPEEGADGPAEPQEGEVASDARWQWSDAWSEGFGRGEIYLALASLLGASLAISMRRVRTHDLSLFFGMIAIVGITGSWTARLVSGETESGIVLAMWVISYVALTVWSAVEVFRQAVARRLRSVNGGINVASFEGTQGLLTVVLTPTAAPNEHHEQKVV